MNTRERELAEGLTGISLRKVNLYRARFGMEPLAELPESEHVERQVIKSTKSHKPVSTRQTQINIVKTNGGPGTELQEILKKYDAPTCGNCAKLAKEMDHLGVDGCREKLEQIVEDIFPRAKEWVEAEKPWVKKWFGEGVQDWEIKRRIRKDVTAAIYEAERKGDQSRKKPIPKPLPHRSGAPVVERVEFGEVTKNLIYHVWPVKNYGTWQWNLERLLKSVDQFNGKRIIAIATDQQTDPAESVKRFVAGHGFEFLEFKNMKAGESVTFPSLLEKIESLNPNHVTFYGHAKGVKYKEINDDSTIKRWASAMYETVLENWHEAKELLTDHAMAGSFLRQGSLGKGKRGRFGFLHYSGTFFWFRNRDVFQRNWNRVPKSYGGVERWPGILFKRHEIACLFGENAGNLYDLNYWKAHIEPELEKWRKNAFTSPKGQRLEMP